MALGEPPQELKDAWALHAARENAQTDALTALPRLLEQLNRMLHDELSLRHRHVQSEKLLQRAVALFEDAWNIDKPADNSLWTTAVGRWISDYERRDEWVTDADHQD